MKPNKNRIILVFLTLLFQACLLNAQEKETPMAQMRGKHEAKPVSWNIIELADNAGNASNGVEFYSRQSACDSKSVRLIKLVNTNNYSVKVSYRLTADAKAVSITLPASSEIEGDCTSNDDRVTQLIINSSVKKGAKENESGNIRFTEVQVTQVQ